MSIKRHPFDCRRKTKAGALTYALLAALALAIPVARAQAQTRQPQIITIRLEADQIGVIKTAERLSTRLAFREVVKEVVCGDLYDPSSGTGSFVVQRIDNDVFLKPVAPKGMTNLFVKVGENGESTYNLSLLIVPVEQAYYVVKIHGVSGGSSQAKKVSGSTRSKPAQPPILPRIEATASMMADGSKVMRGLVPVKWMAGAENPEPPSGLLKPAGNSTQKAIVDYSNRPPREIIKRTIPEYPEQASLLGIKGEVVVEVTVNAKGEVVSVRALTGPSILRNAATSAAKSWKFKPVKGVISRSRVDVVQIVFNFKD